jgi:YHS domain-containing protein
MRQRILPWASQTGLARLPEAAPHLIPCTGHELWELSEADSVNNSKRDDRGRESRRTTVKRFLGPALAMTLLISSIGSVLAAKSDKEETVICPVLKQKVAKSKAIKVVHNGKTYYVCCDSCADQIKSGKFK